MHLHCMTFLTYTWARTSFLRVMEYTFLINNFKIILKSIFPPKQWNRNQFVQSIAYNVCHVWLFDLNQDFFLKRKHLNYIFTISTKDHVWLINIFFCKLCSYLLICLEMNFSRRTQYWNTQTADEICWKRIEVSNLSELGI